MGAGGAVLGSVLAAPFGKYMFDMYVDFFNLPDTVYHNYMDSRINGLLIAWEPGWRQCSLGSGISFPSPRRRPCVPEPRQGRETFLFPASC